MKNIVEFNTNNRCDYCYKNGFYITTPFGADYITCPICCSYADMKNIDERIDVDKTPSYKGDNTNVDTHFCPKCRILFEIGCNHAVNGCTDNITNSHFIGEWKDKTTGLIYIGMPQFDSIEEYIEKVDNIDIIKYICPNDINTCIKSHYPQSKYPQYYQDCLDKK